MLTSDGFAKDDCAAWLFDETLHLRQVQRRLYRCIRLLWIQSFVLATGHLNIIKVRRASNREDMFNHHWRLVEGNTALDSMSATRLKDPEALQVETIISNNCSGRHRVHSEAAELEERPR